MQNVSETKAVRFRRAHGEEEGARARDACAEGREDGREANVASKALEISLKLKLHLKWLHVLMISITISMYFYPSWTSFKYILDDPSQVTNDEGGEEGNESTRCIDEVSLKASLQHEIDMKYISLIHSIYMK